MLFSSLVFLFYFLPLTMIVYWILPKSLKNPFCLLISLFFYAWGEPSYVILMLLSILVNYILGNLLNFKEINRKLILILALVFNLGMLVVFKYTGFIVSNISRALGFSISVPHISLPLGISFYTFQALSYIIDVYRGDTKSQKSLIKLGLYISAYPQLVAGPIVRYNTVMEQIDERYVNTNGISKGFARFVIGLSKKVLLSNQLAIIADWTFHPGKSPSTSLGAWLGILAYSLQIYYDFSGYSDMAIGLGLMLGFEYEENFNYPYTSKSVSEFWRRWHISLGTWFKDYLYIPLGGNRVSKSRHIFNLFVVWAMTGLWHGAEWTFVIWGIYYFFILVIENYLINLESIPTFLRHLITLVLVACGWVIFRSESIYDAFNYIKAMFSIDLGSHRLVGNHVIINDFWYIYLLAIVGSTPIVKNLYTKLFEDKPGILVTLVQSLGLLILFFWSTMYLVNSTYNPFIYFRF